MGFKPLLPNGYGLDVGMSALQKSIRRGEEDTALYWAYQIAARFPNVLWKRLTTIASEDVGQADAGTVILINVMSANYHLIRENARKTGTSTKTDNNSIAMAVLSLCRAPKCRENDEASITIRALTRLGWVPFIDIDVVYDKHTQEGRQLGRGFKHFFEAGTALVNAVPGKVKWFQRLTPDGHDPTPEELARVMADVAETPDPGTLQGAGDPSSLFPNEGDGEVKE